MNFLAYRACKIAMRHQMAARLMATGKQSYREALKIAEGKKKKKIKRKPEISYKLDRTDNCRKEICTHPPALPPITPPDPNLPPPRTLPHHPSYKRNISCNYKGYADQEIK